MRKRLYDTPEQMQARIDAYFERCAGEWARGADGQIILDKRGKPFKVHNIPPTIAGLALALGFSGRKVLWDYQHRPAFRDTVTIAKSRCELYAEERLFDRDGFAGARFVLTSCFGWGWEPVEAPPKPPAFILSPRGQPRGQISRGDTKGDSTTR